MILAHPFPECLPQETMQEKRQLASKYTVKRRRELKKMERRRREMEIILLKHVNDPKTTYSLSHSFFCCNGPTQMMRLRQ
jgi:hypothetical protein